jgi:dinuclear metal center YbgI/SA1388 family protein
MLTLADVVGAFDRRYPRSWAEPWDAVGLTCGDPSAPVARILFAVDPSDAVIDEAVAGGVDLLVTHHPLLLRPVSQIAADTDKGRAVHRLIRAGCALFTAHTNADVADPGVSDALAGQLGLTDLRPLIPATATADRKLVVFAPTDAAPALLDALSAAGAGVIGAYDRCAWTTDGRGTFRAGDHASPTIGARGATTEVDEVRIEVVVPIAATSEVVAALRHAHPYEEPAFDVYERVAPDPSARGLGRIGRLETPMRQDAFVQHIAERLPVGAAGVRATGAADRLITTVAVCGGAGDSALDAVAAAGVDAYVTGDLRHHRAGEFIDRPGAAVLVDASHFGTEWPWLPQAARLLADDLVAAGLLDDPGSSGGATVDIAVSTTVTDPWTRHAPAAASASDDGSSS